MLVSHWSAVATLLALSAPLKLLLGGAAITVGVLVGLVPALLLGMALGLVPRPHVLRSRSAAPPRAALHVQGPVRAILVAEPAAVDAPTIALPAALREHVEPAPEPAEEIEVDAVRERHRGLYDEEYSKQLDHLDTLRRTIRTRLAVGAQPLSDDAPREP